MFVEIIINSIKEYFSLIHMALTSIREKGKSAEKNHKERESFQEETEEYLSNELI